MPCPSRTWAALALLAAISPGVASAQDQPTQEVRVPLAPEDPEPWKRGEAIKPLPLTPIPDDPPPHEGAMIDIPYIIEPPDILVVEVLEGLPSRPITGERLVRPDGKITLGFYGDVGVRGLTIEQAKIRIVHHLQQHLNDETLGLIQHIEVRREEAPAPPDSGRAPFEIKPAVPGEIKPVKPPEEPPATELPPTPAVKPRAARATSIRPRHRPARRARTVGQVPAPKGEAEVMPDGQPGEQKPGEVDMREVILMSISPADTNRVFVDVASFNTKVYYVQGDVGSPGRLPFTGNETVLDALQYGGGLTATAEPTDVHLYRPARAGKPAKDYKVDLFAILRGDAIANLQVFPNDRLVIGRNATVKRTIEIDRAAAPINSVFNTLLQKSFTTRSMGAATGLINESNEAGRDAMLKDWSEFLWDLSSQGGGALLDDKAFRDAVLKKLGPAAKPK